MSTNPEKPNLEAALSSTPVAAKKSRFRPTFRSPRIPRETKLGLGIIFSLVCLFGYVLYSRLTRPADMDPEKYVAQGSSLLAPSVTSDQPTSLAVQNTSLAAQPAAHSPTILPGTAPHNSLPLTNPANSPAAASQYSAPTGGAGQAAWSPNSTAANTTSSDPFMNRGSSTVAHPDSPAASFSASGFGANSTASDTTPGAAKQPAAAGYGLNDTSDTAEGPRNSFLPPTDRAASGTAALNASTSQPEQSATAVLNDPTHSVTAGSGSPVDALSKSANDSLSKLRQEGQDLVNSGTTAKQNLGKASDSANQLLNQAQQQLGQYANSAGTNANTLLNQAKDASTQYGADLKSEVQNQAGQYAGQLRNTTQDQFQQAQNQLRSNAGNLVNDTTNQLRSTTESVMTKAGDSTQNLLNSATTAINGSQPLAPLATTNSAASAAQPASAYGMPAAQAPRTLDQSQTASQPLNSATPNYPAPGNTGFASAQQPEQPIRIPAESSSFTTQPAASSTSAMAAQPNYGAAPNGPATPNYGTPANTATTPSYGTTPAYGGAPATPAASGTPLQFNQPTMPAAQPAAPVYGGATRTNFEQPASANRGVQQYTVTAQDSYYSVAEKMYGNGGLNKALYEYNRRNNPAADRLQVGGAMLIPDLATLQAQFPDLVPSTSTAATINPTPLQFPR